MVNQKEAETLAQKHIQDYLNACNLDTPQDAGNALMKLCSVAGVMMCAAVGYDEAIDRLYGTAAFIANTMQGIQFNQVKEH